MVRLFNTSGWMPNIDCMKVTFVEGSGVSATTQTKSQQTVYALDGQPLNSTTESAEDALSSAPRGIYVVGGRKVLKR